MDVNTWDLRSVSVGRMIGRLTLAALGVGVVGGTLTAWLPLIAALGTDMVDGPRDALVLALAVMLFGSMFGLLPALASLLVLVPVLLVLRGSAHPPGLVGAQNVVASTAAVITGGGCLLFIGLGPVMVLLAAPAALIAGVGARRVSRWCLSGSLVDKHV